MLVQHLKSTGASQDIIDEVQRVSKLKQGKLEILDVDTLMGLEEF